MTLIFFSFPFSAMSFINYVLLCLVYTTWLACRSGEGSLLKVIRNRGYKYFILAAIDVEANYLVLRAYQYTSVTSVQVLVDFFRDLIKGFLLHNVR